MASQLSRDEFIAAARRIHGPRYVYDSLIYTNSRTKVEVGCPEHGSYWVKAGNHLNRKSGCPRCAGEATRHRLSGSTKQFIKRAREVHGNRYDYEKVVYRNNSTPVEIICSIHGAFSQTPNAHTQAGSGCPRCGIATRSEMNQMSFQEFVKRARKIHSDFYEYDETSYTKAISPVRIQCPNHGWFSQKASNHLLGQGCRACGYKRNGETSLEAARLVFVPRAVELHGTRYGYDRVIYKGNAVPVEIVCSKHGAFWQRPNDHLQGCGCPTCGSQTYTSSVAESEIANYLSGLRLELKTKDRTIIHPRELDIVCEKQKIAIEYCGLYWHSEMVNSDHYYHFDKMTEANSRGYELITIFEDEWRDRPEVVKSLLKNRLTPERGIRVDRVNPLDSKTASLFLHEHHIQGSGPARYYYGGYVSNRLIGVMSFGLPTRQSTHRWELKRFATDGHRYHGLGSKLFARFIRDHDPSSVVSFSDRRWFSGGLYERLGFRREAELAPDYSVVRGSERIYKGRFRKSRLLQMYPNETGSEWEILQRHGYSRIWDCGKIRWVWTKSV